MRAPYSDFKKPVAEAQIEVDSIVGEIDFATAFLESWMRPEIVTTPDILNTMAGSAGVSKIILEPKGVCLFITPWNIHKANS